MCEIIILSLGPSGEMNNKMIRMLVGCQLDHPNIVPLSKVVISDRRELQLWFPRSGIGLQDLPGNITHQNVLSIIEQISAVIHYCHSRGVIHGNLHPRNIRITGEPPQVQIIGFGSGTNDDWKSLDRIVMQLIGEQFSFNWPRCSMLESLEQMRQQEKKIYVRLPSSNAKISLAHLDTLFSWFFEIANLWSLDPQISIAAALLCLRYLSRFDYQLQLDRLQLIGVVCLHIAVAIYDDQDIPPADYIWLCNQPNLGIDDFIEIFYSVLMQLHFILRLPDPILFLRVAGAKTEAESSLISAVSQNARLLIELPPSQLAADFADR